MKKPPFILVNCLTTKGGEITGGNGRSVAFPVARTKRGRHLFATCAHAIVDHLNKGLPLHTCYEDGTQLPLGEPIRNNVIPPQRNCDLSFFELDVDRPIGFARFSGKTVSSGVSLSHVRNTSFREDLGDDMCIVTAQMTGRTTGRFLYTGTQFLPLDDNLKRSIGIVPKAPHKGVIMRSWPGVSGSPLWDKFGNVLGMVAGGTEELTAERPEYNLIYLPAKQIQSCMKEFMHHLV